MCSVKAEGAHQHHEIEEKYSFTLTIRAHENAGDKRGGGKPITCKRMESGEDRDADLADHAGEVCDGDPAKEPLRLAGEGPADAMEEDTVAAASRRQRGPGRYHQGLDITSIIPDTPSWWASSRPLETAAASPCIPVARS